MALFDDEANAIEAAYRRSAFVREICVIAIDTSDVPAPYAIVVPDMDLMAQRRIANVGDLLRFELEGQSIHLRAGQRVRAYEVWFEPLPRDASGAIDRDAVRRRVLARRSRHGRRFESPPYAPASDAEAVVVDVVQSRARDAAIRPDANLEIDLGLDSIDRVEVLAELERRLGARIAEGRAHEVLTLGQLVESFASGNVRIAAASPDGPWKQILSGRETAVASELTWVLKNGGAGMAAVYSLLRVARLLMPRMIVTGREHLPANGPYILCPNHQSFIDPFVICSTLPYRLVKQMFAVGAAEYFETPLTTWIARQCKLLPVDPDGNLVGAMRAAAVGLEHGKILVLFPEGERSIDGEVKRFKKGAAILAQQLNVPIVPVALNGSFDVWPRNRALDWRAVLPWAGHHVGISFGSPMQFGPTMSVADATTVVQRRVGELWSELARSPQPGPERKHAGDASGEHDAKLRTPRHKQQPRER